MKYCDMLVLATKTSLVAANGLENRGQQIVFVGGSTPLFWAILTVNLIGKIVNFEFTKEGSNPSPSSVTMAEQFMRFPVKEEYLSASLSSHPVHCRKHC